ncbi:MAG TPA: VWA domain-containing protein [Acidisarcina sp.]|nr:VWA domain-containing protein [Acidisarcina sp.]
MAARTVVALTVVAIFASLLLPWLRADAQETSDSRAQNNGQSFTLKVESDLVLTNVVVRDKKTGEVVRGLTENDFTVLESGRQQRIATFDFQSVDQAVALQEATVSGTSGPIVLGKPGTGANDEQLRNHRLIVLFFDLTSMQVEDLDRSVAAARDYINKQMQPADLVALVSLSTSLSLDQDFTSNKKLLLSGVGRYNGSEGQGFAQGGTGNASEDASGYTADESEYNSINTDRELFAIAAVAKSLAGINQKKSLLYFSGGLTRSGIENQASLRAVVNASVRANVSIYSVDTRGLEAISPLGDATKGSLRGTGAFNGSAMQTNLDANFSSQETLSTLSADTGGKAFLDANDFAPAFQRIQQDTSAYYVLGFRSTNLVRDGRFRKLTIRVNRKDVKLEYRPGYYAPADFRHSNKEDRERELTEQLQSDLPATDVSVYLQALYFRLDENRFYVPVSIIVPGSQIPFVKGGDRDKATLDIIGEIKDAQGHQISDARETVKLAIDESQQIARKNIQYSTAFTLPAGKFHLKFLVRENETGRMGSFEADITVPDLKKMPLKMSSIVLSSQRVPAGKQKSESPLVRDGLQWVPNVSHVFRGDQHLYFLYEVYDPTAVKAATKSTVKVLTSIEFLQGSTKVFETPLVEANATNVAGRDAVAFQFDVPLTDLKAGLYTCQINVIDDAGGSFSFPRLALLVRDSSSAAAALPAPSSHVSPGTEKR